MAIFHRIQVGLCWAFRAISVRLRGKLRAPSSTSEFYKQPYYMSMDATLYIRVDILEDIFLNVASVFLAR